MKSTQLLLRLRSASGIGLFIFVLTALKVGHAQTCYAEPYSNNGNYVQVTIDTRGMETNALLSGVVVEVTYRVGTRDGKKSWPFTANNGLRANHVYRNYFALNEGPDVEIMGGTLSYSSGPAGEVYDTAPSRKPLSHGMPPQKADVIGELPPSVALPPPGTPSPSVISGAWRFTTHSSVSGETHKGAVVLRTNGDSVFGTIETFDKSNTVLTGTFNVVQGRLTLTRDTGLETTQKYALEQKGDSFLGKFWNEGKFKDEGTVELVRPEPGAPSDMGAEVH